ncbi:hypothetical protein ACFQOZ_00810 [Comamonas endophytica]|uniref:hypothetical protein n=1 Tax=Comamonas endophytica TaxID=2949090 RepID=UPI00361653BD
MAFARILYPGDQRIEPLAAWPAGFFDVRRRGGTALTHLPGSCRRRRCRGYKGWHPVVRFGIHHGCQQGRIHHLGILIHWNLDKLAWLIGQLDGKNGLGQDEQGIVMGKIDLKKHVGKRIVDGPCVLPLLPPGKPCWADGVNRWTARFIIYHYQL